MFSELPKSKVNGKVKFGEWIDLAIRILKIWIALLWRKSKTSCQIRQTFPLPDIPAIW